MTDRQQLLTEALESRILVIDGAMGQMLQLNMTVADYGGAHLENLTDYIVKTRPDVVAGIHKMYLEAGADIIETNTFNGTHLVLSDFHVGDEAYALNKAAAELARQAAAEYSTPDKPRWVAGSMGPTTRAISVTGGVTFDELRQNYYDQARALVDGGVDVLLLETCNDTRSVKAGLLGIERLRQELGRRIPIMLSATIEPMGSMLAGQGADAFWTSVSHADLISVGLNCGTGPEFMTDHLRTLHELATTRISC
jgi:5-methyltetrahydrofolate--homocysteine methyltransferase